MKPQAIRLEPIEGEGLRCQTCTAPGPVRHLWKLHLGPCTLELCSACIIVLRVRLRAGEHAPHVRPNISLEDSRRGPRPQPRRKG